MDIPSAFLGLMHLLGALGVFLLGMKFMSEALQKVAGARLKGLLAAMTGNRVMGVLSGFAITVLVQSSTASTVMLVGFVAAGLVSLTQAVGVIMGANIGTTLTAWVVALLGFNFNITAFALPAVGLGLLGTYLRGARRRQWGEVLIGFGLLFLGLALIQDSVPTIEDPTQLAWVQDMAGYGVLSVLFFVAGGMLLTIVVQSSSAATALTLTLAALGWIPYEMALAMILGENIGTTVTANLAAVGANTVAKRAARVHLLFNLLGLLWALLLFRPVLLPVVDVLTPGDPSVDFTQIREDPTALAAASAVVTMHLAVFHTLFNVTNTVVMLPFAKQLERIVRAWVPERNGDRKLKYLSSRLIETPEFMIDQAAREMQHMTEVVREMFGASLHILTHPGEKLGDLVEETLDKEELCDDLEREIVAHLTMTARSATSAAASRKIAELIQNTHRLERMADHCAVLVRIAQRIHESGQRFASRDARDLEQLGQLVDQTLDNLSRYLVGDTSPEAGEVLEDQVDEMRRMLRTRHVGRMRESAEHIETELAFLDAITHLEEIADRAVGIIRLAEKTRRM